MQYPSRLIRPAVPLTLNPPSNRSPAASSRSTRPPTARLAPRPPVVDFLHDRLRPPSLTARRAQTLSWEIIQNLERDDETRLVFCRAHASTVVASPTTAVCTPFPCPRTHARAARPQRLTNVCGRVTHLFVHLGARAASRLKIPSQRPRPAADFVHSASPTPRPRPHPRDASLTRNSPRVRVIRREYLPRRQPLRTQFRVPAVGLVKVIILSPKRSEIDRAVLHASTGVRRRASREVSRARGVERVVEVMTEQTRRVVRARYRTRARCSSAGRRARARGRPPTGRSRRARAREGRRLDGAHRGRRWRTVVGLTPAARRLGASSAKSVARK